MAITRPLWACCILLTTLITAFRYANGDEKSPLTCYTCTGVLGEHDPEHCGMPDANTTAKLCSTEQVFCKKRVVRAAGTTTIERRCYDTMCTDQQGIAMGQGIYIDTFCCRDELCNLAPNIQHSSFLLVTVIFTLSLLLIMW